MARARQGGATAKTGASGGGGLEESSAADPRQKMVASRIRAAKAFNESHADLVDEFNRLTEGAYAGPDGGIDARKVMSWQRAQGLKVDGKVGKGTVEAARRANGKIDADGEQSAGNEDAFEGEGVSEDGPVLENPSFTDNIAEGARGMKAEEKPDLGGGLAGAGEAADRVHKGAEFAAGKMPANDALGEGMGGDSEIEPPWVKAAMAPAILELLREGKVSEAIEQLALTFSPSEYVEGLTLACEKLGLHHLIPKLTKLASLGAAADVAWDMFWWSYDGLKSIGEAHEAGDRDSRIAIYADAFAEAFLYGEAAGDNPGAVTNEEREAVERGRKDGAATAGAEGEMAASVGKQLLKKYGSAHNAKQAIVDELMKRAGFEGIELHERSGASGRSEGASAVPGE